MSFYPPESGAMRPPSADRSTSGSHEVRQASEAEAGAMVAAGGPSLLSNIIQQCSRNPAQFQRHFWRHQMDLVENGLDTDGKPIDFYNLGSASNGNSSALPLARIKKVMKNDDEVKMISAEAPILFSRVCEIFISDLTCRAFMVAEENKRRTIQRSDIANAVARSDLFDFLIDIVPRSDMVRNRGGSMSGRSAVPVASMPSSLAASGRGMGEGGMLETSKPEASYAPLRAAQQDLRVGEEPPMPIKGNEWGPPMYPFHSGIGMHPSAGLGMPPPQPAPQQGPAALSIPGHGARGSFLNMMPYSMGEGQQKPPDSAGPE